jgi:hypothetical protein
MRAVLYVAAMPHTVRSMCLGLIAAAAVAQCPPAVVVDDFTGWSTTEVLNIPATNPWAAGASTANGNPGACFEVSQSVIAGVVNAQIHVAHLPPTSIALPPSGLGPIDLSLDGIHVMQSPPGAFGNAVAVRFCVEQGGVVYVAANPIFNLILGNAWTTMTAPGLVATSFAPQGVAGVHPDFAAGGPVRFGFVTINGNTSGGTFSGAGIGSTLSRYDNFNAAFTAAAALTTTVAGCGAAPAPTLSATAPAFDATVTITLSGAPASAPAALVWGSPVPPIALGGGCSTAMDLNTLFIFAAFVTDAGGGWTTSFYLPPICALAGLPIAQQAFVFDAASPFGFSLSNGLLGVVGS